MEGDINPAKDQIDNLQCRAAETLCRLSEFPESRPLFIEFAGTPKSGKSTCIDTVNHFFRRLGYKVLAPTEGASKRTPYYLKGNLVAFNAWSATYALTHILEGRFGSDQYQLVIMDRGLFDALAWFELLRQKCDITSEELSAIHNFLLVDHWRKLVDMIFLFQTDPCTSLERENDNKLIQEPGRTMNPAFLNDLNAAYDRTKQQYADKFSHFHSVDTRKGASTQQSTAFTVAQAIIDQLSQNQAEC